MYFHTLSFHTCAIYCTDVYGTFCCRLVNEPEETGDLRCGVLRNSSECL